MIKQYEIPVQIVIPEHMNDLLTLTGDLSTINVYEDGEGFLLESSKISEVFLPTVEVRDRTLTKEGYLLKQEKGFKDQSLFLELYQNPRYLDDPKSFMNRYGSLLKPVVPDQLHIDDDLMVYGVKITDDKVYLSLSEDYATVPKPYVDLAIVQNTPPIYEGYGNTLYVNKEKLLSLKEGYYNILPRIFFERNTNTFSEYEIVIHSDVFTQVVSIEKFSIGYSSNFAYINPNRRQVITLTEDCKNPLESKDQLLKDREYILYKASKNALEPYCKVSAKGEEPPEDFKLLMNSHLEYLRPYYYLVDEVTLSVNSETVKLKNKDFKRLREENLYLPHYNFNFKV